MDQRLLNDILNNNTHDVAIVNDIIGKGANSYFRALMNASRNNHTDSIEVLKLLVTTNEGLRAAACTNNTALISYFSAATNYDECVFEAATRNYTESYDLLKGSATADVGMKSATYIHNHTDIAAFKTAGATNYNDCLEVATRLGHSCCVQTQITNGATNC